MFRWRLTLCFTPVKKSDKAHSKALKPSRHMGIPRDIMDTLRLLNTGLRCHRLSRRNSSTIIISTTRTHTTKIQVKHRSRRTLQVRLPTCSNYWKTFDSLATHHRIVRPQMIDPPPILLDCSAM